MKKKTSSVEPDPGAPKKVRRMGKRGLGKSAPINTGGADPLPGGGPGDEYLPEKPSPSRSRRE